MKEKKVLTLDLQKIADTLREKAKTAEQLQDAFGMSRKRCEEIVDPLDYDEILGGADNVGVMLADVIETAMTATDNDVEAFWLLYQMISIYQKHCEPSNPLAALAQALSGDR